MAETFLIAFERRHTFDPSVENVLPWLLGIATNLLRRHHRAEARTLRAYVRSVSRHEESWSAAVDDRMDLDVATGLVAAALSSLSAIDRDTILLFTWGELTYDEIAHAMDVPIGTVRSRLNRARTTLRHTLGFSPLTERDADHGRSSAAPSHR